MKKRNYCCIRLVAVACGLITLTPSSAQVPDAGIRLISGTKPVFSDPGGLKQIADAFYFSTVPDLSGKILNELRSEVKRVTGQSSRAEKTELSLSPSMEIRQDESRTFIAYSIPVVFDFKVTTPDIPIIGIGASRGGDMNCFIQYVVTAEYEIQQSGTLESLTCRNAKWSGFTKTVFIDDAVIATDGVANMLNGQEDRKKKVAYWAYKEMGAFVIKNFLPLNQVSGIVQQYFDNVVRGNKSFLAEMNIDENTKIEIAADPEKNTLLVIHPYSPKGIVKRTATTNAAEAVDNSNRQKAISPKTTTSASEINRGPAVTLPAKRTIIH